MVRSNYASESNLGGYFDLCGVDSPGIEWVALTSKLVAARKFRSSTVAYRLAAATYRDALAAGIPFGFLDCEPSWCRCTSASGTVRSGPSFTGSPTRVREWSWCTTCTTRGSSAGSARRS